MAEDQKTTNRYKVVIPYSESAGGPDKHFTIDYNIEAPDRETALKKAEREFMGYHNNSSASWVRTIEPAGVRAWRILPNAPQTVQALDELGANLASVDQDTLYNVLNALGELEDAAFAPKILPLLNHENPDLATLAADILGKAGDATCIGPLLGKFTPDAPPRLKACVLSSLARLASSADPIENVVAAALGDKDSRVRANAVELVEKLHLSGVAMKLVPMLTDEDNRVKANVLKALWNIHDREELKKTLHEMIVSPNRWMRISGVFVLRQIDIEERFTLLEQLAADSDVDLQNAVMGTMLCLDGLEYLPWWLEAVVRQKTTVEHAASKMERWGRSAFEPLIAWQNKNPGQKEMVRQCIEHLAKVAYRDREFWDWLRLKGMSFVSKMK